MKQDAEYPDPNAMLAEVEAEGSAWEPTCQIIDKSDKPQSVLTTARAYAAAGISCIPIRTDGSKAPACGSWKRYQTDFPLADEVDEWFDSSDVGVATICGAVSGGLEVIDVDEAELHPHFRELVEDAAPGLWERLTHNATPEGYHVAYRCETIEGNQVLAARFVDGKRRALIETRGERGYVVAPGSPGACHPTGKPYRHIAGPAITEVNTITPAERVALFWAARKLNEVVEELTPTEPPVAATAPAHRGPGLSPGEDFENRATWAEVLPGWTEVYHGKYRRPGKSDGISASICLSQAGHELLSVFSTSTPFPIPAGKTCGSFSKFACYAYLNHDGDFSAAASDLRRQGYGDQQPKPRNEVFGGCVGETSPNQGKSRVSVTPTVQEIFPTHVFPEAIQDFISSIAETVCVSPAMPAALMLPALSMSMGMARRVRVNSTFSQLPLIWLAVVARSGDGKTPAQNIVFRYLRERQAREFAKYLEANRQYQAEYEVWKIESRTKRPKGEPAPVEPVAPVCTRYLVQDATTEALLGVMAENPRGVGLDADELAGLVLGLNQYKGGKGNDLQKFLPMFDGGLVASDRKTGQKLTVVEMAGLTIAGGIQQGTLQRIAGPELFENGFMARLLLVESVPVKRTWSEKEIPPATIKKVDGIFARLLALNLPFGENGSPLPQDVPLSAEAKILWASYYDKHQEDRQAEGDAMAAVYSKLLSYTLRFALLLEYAHWAAGYDFQEPEEVSSTNLERATILSNYFLSEIRRLYGALSEPDDDRYQRELVAKVSRLGESVTARDLAKSSRHYTSTDDAEADLQSLVNAKLGEWVDAPPSSKGGRPTRSFRLLDASA